MKTNLKHNQVLQFGIAVLMFAACSKAYLDKKPSSNIVVPTSLEELRGLLDNEAIVFETPLLGTQSADEYYFTYEDWQGLNPKERNAYVWAKDIYEGHAFAIKDWDVPYQQIFYANIALEAFHSGNVDSLSQEARAIMGSAYFLRGRALFNLAEHFAMPYEETTATSLPGVPFKANPDVSVPVSRGSLADTYTQVVTDMERAAKYLTDLSFPDNKLRPTKITAYGYLARIYLSMREYQQAYRYADSALSLYDKLIDYNTLDPQGYNPFPATNAETILQSRMVSGVLDFTTASGTLYVDSNLYSLYDDHDLRKVFYYYRQDSRVGVLNSYAGLIQFFTGLTTAELFLIRAECQVRQGVIDRAIADINRLLSNRYESQYFHPVSEMDPDELLEIILRERRKELAFRGIRWSDIRRLNQEGHHIVLRRRLNGENFELTPGNSRYALPIPQLELERSGFEQNQR